MSAQNVYRGGSFSRQFEDDGVNYVMFDIEKILSISDRLLMLVFISPIRVWFVFRKQGKGEQRESNRRG